MHKDAAYSLYPPRGPMNGRRYAALVAVTLFCLLTFLSSPLFQFSPVIFPHFSLQQFRISKSGPAVPVCANLPGADQTLVVVKTGATEFIEKFPIHLKTTLQCYPNYLVFSDHEEIFKGEVVRNALDTVNEDVLDDHDEYELYRQLRDGGRGSLLPGQLSSSHAASDRTDRPGWKLDRWKFLPMLNQSYHLRPDMKWYLFLETDTFPFWSTMLQFQRHLNPEKPYYMGAQVYVNNIEFGHGGSGLLVSHTALRKLVDYLAGHQTKCESKTSTQTDGDVLTGETFAAAGVRLTRTWPLIQGDHPGDFPYGEQDGHGNPRWCYPTTTWHHVAPEIINELWHFEQRWLSSRERSGNDSDYLRYRDVFQDYVMPRMRSRQENWDNHCNDLRKGVDGFEECRSVCEADGLCLQYRYDNVLRECRTANNPMLGEVVPRSKLSSGWIYRRIEHWKDDRPACEKDLWITANL